MSEEVQEKASDDVMWMRMMKRYAIGMVIGIAILAYAFPQLQVEASKPVLLEILLGGILTFGGGFGIAVSLFFHLWHSKES